MIKYFIPLGLFTLFSLISCRENKYKNYRNWNVTGGNKQSIRYYALTGIDTNNVSQLKVAWEYHTGDADTAKHSQIQCNPIIVDGIMYATSPRLKLIALDAATGNLKWAFDPDASNKNNSAFHFAVNNNRGVTYWENKDDKRILYTAGAVLYEINANDGTIIPSFGNGGKIDLHDDLGRDVKDLDIAGNSPGIIYKDLFILGSRVDEGPAAAPGHIRAYNVRTGKLEW